MTTTLLQDQSAPPGGFECTHVFLSQYVSTTKAPSRLKSKLSHLFLCNCFDFSSIKDLTKKAENSHNNLVFLFCLCINYMSRHVIRKNVHMYFCHNMFRQRKHRVDWRTEESKSWVSLSGYMVAAIKARALSATLEILDECREHKKGPPHCTLVFPNSKTCKTSLTYK